MGEKAPVAPDPVLAVDPHPLDLGFPAAAGRQMLLDPAQLLFGKHDRIRQPGHALEQGLSLALAVTEYALSNTTRPSAWRIHGGGFAGTIQAFVPNEDVTSYKNEIERVFGENSCTVLKVRKDGAIKVL